LQRDRGVAVISAAMSYQNPGCGNLPGPGRSTGGFPTASFNAE
jgi:hypothetical protein